MGTRPNYIKITQFKKVAAAHFPGCFNIKILHTGQHFDKAMADDFFEQLDISPDFFLNISPGSPAQQVGEIIMKMETVLLDFKPDWVLVPGDVNSTLAAAVCAHKAGFKLAHIESGLRSFDRTMPEEINRIITDELSDLFFVTEQSGVNNLLKEGKSSEKIHLVGNTMIDTMLHFSSQINENPIATKLGLNHKSFALITIHRQATTDNVQELKKLVALLKQLATKIKLVFPIHPRTNKNLKTFGFWDELSIEKNIVFCEPLDYFSFQALINHCRFVLTDSGGVQEETTFQKVPCLTLRPNTERPITIEVGSNELIPFDENIINNKVNEILENSFKVSKKPSLWDGNATERILKILLQSPF